MQESRLLLPSRIGARPWVFSIAALTGVTALSIDMSLPAQPTLAHRFQVPSEVAGLTLSLFLGGFAIGQILFGGLSDAFGRRRILLAGLALFTLAGVLCATSPSITALIAARVVQGLGAAAAPVIARAMVRDTQPAKEAARILSTVMAVLAIAPMLAPLAGGWVLAHFDWRGIFFALTALGIVLSVLVVLTLSETRPKEQRAPFSLTRTLAGFSRFLRLPGTLVPTALVCLSFAGQFAFISDSPFVLIDGFSVPADRFGLYFGATALALMASSLLGGRLLRTWSPTRVLRIGVSMLSIGGVLSAIFVRVVPTSPFGLIVPMLVYFVGIGLTGPSATALAMEPAAELAGTASAVIGFLQVLAGGISGYLTTRIGGSNPRMLGGVVAVVGLLAVTLTLLQARTSAKQAKAAVAAMPSRSG